MPTLQELGFYRAGMGILSPEHSVRPQGNVYNVTSEDDEEMADDKEGSIDRRKSAERAIIEKEEGEKEETTKKTGWMGKWRGDGCQRQMR